jgi:ABC-type transporter Mla MlaB component
MVHASREASTFALFADSDRLVLIGSVDAASCDRLGRLLAGAPTRGDVVVLDLAGLEFVDVASCRVLARWVAGLVERSVTVQMTGSSLLLRRMWQVLGLEQVAPVTFEEIAG